MDERKAVSLQVCMALAALFPVFSGNTADLAVELKMNEAAGSTTLQSAVSSYTATLTSGVFCGGEGMLK